MKIWYNQFYEQSQVNNHVLKQKPPKPRMTMADAFQAKENAPVMAHKPNAVTVLDRYQRIFHEMQIENLDNIFLEMRKEIEPYLTQ